MRWADLDLLGHVNNVVYVDYLQEARVDMLRVHARSPRTDGLAEGVVVASHQISYLEPLLYDRSPVHVEVWVTEIRAASFTLAYEIFRDTPDGGRTVYLRASTVLTPYVFEHEAPRRLTAEERADLEVYLHPEDVLHPHAIEVGEAHHTEVGHYPVDVRFSDVDVYGHVNNVKHVEYFQEGRVALLGRLGEKLGDELGGEHPFHVVVAQTDIVYRAPMLMRPQPYDLYTWVARVGSKSVVFDSEIVDGPAERPAVLARARIVLVFFDLESGRSVSPPESVRRTLESLARG